MATKSSRAKRILRIVVGVLGCYALWFAAHKVFGQAMPPLLWTEHDLPPIPPADTNGYVDAIDLFKTQPPTPKDVALLVSPEPDQRPRVAAKEAELIAWVD